MAVKPCVQCSVCVQLPNSGVDKLKRGFLRKNEKKMAVCGIIGKAETAWLRAFREVLGFVSELASFIYKK